MVDHGSEEVDSIMESQYGVEHGKLGIDNGISKATIEMLGNDETMVYFQVNSHVRGQKFEIFENCLREEKISIGRTRELEASTWNLKTWFKKAQLL